MVTVETNETWQVRHVSQEKNFRVQIETIIYEVDPARVEWCVTGGAKKLCHFLFQPA